MFGTAYLVYHTCYTLCIMYGSRGLFKLRHKSWLNHIHGEDNAYKCRCASTSPHTGWNYWFTETCTIFALLSYKFMIIHYFTNNLSGLPSSSHTPDSDMPYSLCPFVIWPAIPEPGHR